MEQVSRLQRELIKFIKGETSDVDRVCDVLDSLANETITLQILKETKIGQTVGKLRKNDQANVATKAKKLVLTWKNAMAGENISVSTPKKNSFLAHPQETKEEVKKDATKPALTPEQSTSSSTTGGKLSSPPKGLSEYRMKVRAKLVEILKVDGEGDYEGVGTEIEEAMAIQYRINLRNEDKKGYAAKFRTLCFNMKKNAALRQNCLINAVTGKELINMTSEQLATEDKKKEREKLRDDAFQRSRLDWAEANADKINKQCGIENDSGLFTCGRCKSSKTSNTQKQTRSADEPMTVFVLCHNCGARWKC